MNELIETLDDLSILINIILINDIEVDITHCELLTKVRNQIDELNKAIILKELNNIRESI